VNPIARTFVLLCCALAIAISFSLGGLLTPPFPPNEGRSQGGTQESFHSNGNEKSFEKFPSSPWWRTTLASLW
jgi:hypothetical protein